MIIGDSSALVALATMNRLDLLESIFGKVYVPQAVYDEVTILGKPQSITLKKFLLDKIIHIDLTITQMGLGRGELEAIALYNHLDSNFLLIDDRRAKKFAKLNGVNVIGSLGVMILAKEKGLIESIKDDLEKLKQADIFISESLIDKVLMSVGE